MKISCFCCEKFCCVWKTKTTWLSAKNSFINRCLFNYRWLLFFYIIYVSLVAFIITTRVCCVVVVVVVVTGTVFLLSSSVYMCFMDSHCIVLHSIFIPLVRQCACHYHIKGYLTWVSCSRGKVWQIHAPVQSVTMLAHGSQKRAWPRGGWLKTHDVKMTDQFQDMKLQDMKLQDRLQDTKMQDINMTDQVRMNRLSIDVNWV